jgi:hypothetical protein
MAKRALNFSAAVAAGCKGIDSVRRLFCEQASFLVYLLFDEASLCEPAKSCWSSPKQASRIVREFIHVWSAASSLAGENLDFVHYARNRQPSQILTWLTHIVWEVLSDPASFMARCKDFAFSCRLAWINKNIDPRVIRWSRTFCPGFLRCRTSKNETGRLRSLLQWSFLGRALPEPTPYFKDQAVEPMLSRVTSQCDATPLDTRLLRKILGKGPARAKIRVCIQSHGACNQAKRREGGRRAFYAGLLDDYLRSRRLPSMVEAALIMRTQPHAVSAARAGPVRAALWSRDFLTEAKSQMDSTSRPVVVTERGWKTRIVSRSCAIRVALSESYRMSVVRRLNRHRAIALPQSGNMDFLPIPFGTASRYVFSADLSSATDLIGEHVLASVAKYLDIPEILVCGGRVVHGDLFDKPMTRGTLMGIPLSFPFLGCIHLYVCFRIKARAGTYYIMGDDLIAVWSARTIAAYKRAMSSLTGMELNEKKSFQSVSRGIFCERAYHLARDGLRVNRQFVSVKAVTPLGRPLQTKGPEARPGMPWELSPLLYLDAHYGRLGHERVFWIQKRLLASFVRKIQYLVRKYHIQPYIPIKWGGAGLFPPKKGWRFSSVEELWLQQLFAGSTVASRRMKAVMFGTAKLAVHDKRASDRIRPVFDKIILTSTGQGLDDEVADKLSQLREFSEDIASAEFRSVPEDIPTQVWFRTLSEIPTGELVDTEGVSRSRTFRDIRDIVLRVDTSKTNSSAINLMVMKKLPLPKPVPSLVTGRLSGAGPRILTRSRFAP